MITAALVALTSAANAVELPKLLAQQGASSWCEVALRSDATATVLQFTESDGQPCGPMARPSSLWVDSNAFGWGEDFDLQAAAHQQGAAGAG